MAKLETRWEVRNKNGMTLTEMGTTRYFGDILELIGGIGKWVEDIFAGRRRGCTDAHQKQNERGEHEMRVCCARTSRGAATCRGSVIESVNRGQKTVNLSYKYILATV